MLEYVKSDKFELVEDVRRRYKNCKVLMVNMDLSDMQNLKGKVYAVSRSKKSFDELCQLKGELTKRGILTMLLGTYNGGMIGVQYEVKF